MSTPRQRCRRAPVRSGPSRRPLIAERIRKDQAAAGSGSDRGLYRQDQPEALGLPLAAWLRIRPIPGQLQKVAEILRDIPEVVECDRVTGEDCFIARAHVASVEAPEQLIDQLIPYSMTNISIIQPSPVQRRLPPMKARPSTDEAHSNERAGWEAHS